MNQSSTAGPIVWLGTILATCLTLYLFQSILWLVVPILLAVILYYVTEPLVNRLIDVGWSRGTAAGVVMGVLVIAAIILGSLSVYRATHHTADVDESWNRFIERYVDSGTKFLAASLNTVEKYAPFVKGIDPLKTQSSWDERFTKWAADNGGDVVVHLLHWLPSLLLVPYLTYFILVDGGRFKRFLVHGIPNAYFEKSLLLFHRIDDQIRRYFQGLMALTVLDTLFLGLGLWALGISYAFPFAAAIAVLSWLPYIGSIIGCVLVILVAATDHPTQTWMAYGAVALFLGVRLMDDFIFMPMTIGRSLEIHPVVTVLMIFIGGAVAGISGLLLVMPVLGVMMVLGQVLGQLATNDRLRARYQNSRALQLKRARRGLEE